MQYLSKLTLIAVALEPALGCKLQGNATPDAVSCADVKPPNQSYFFDSGPTCPPWACGTNSATVGDGIAFDWIDGSGREEGPHGIKIQSAKLRPEVSNNPIEFFVEGDRLFARDPGAPATTLPYGDQALVGATFIVTAHLPDAMPPRDVMHELTIVEVIDLPNDPQLRYWAYEDNDVDGQRESVPFYRIVSRPVGVMCEPVNICRQNVGATDPARWGGRIEHAALVFTGERYRDNHEVMDVAPPTTWFNLACAGTAAAKMHLLRHTNAGALGGTSRYTTAPDERNAMLKMFTADYCGTGRTFTVDGQPLGYMDSNHWYHYENTPKIEADGTVSPPGTLIEALWGQTGVGQTGAVCLDEPRRAAATMPVARSEVENDCLHPAPPLVPRPVPPPCTFLDGATRRIRPEYWRWETQAHVLSALPPGP